MNDATRSFGAVLFGVGLFACSGDGSSNDGLAESRLEGASDTEGVDCRAACPASLGRWYQGPVSAQRAAVLSYWQLNTCDQAPPPADSTAHTLRAGEACWSAASPAHGQPLDGADACEEFVCDEAGAFHASACVHAALEVVAPVAALPLGRCASRSEACALAREHASTRGGADLLCR